MANYNSVIISEAKKTSFYEMQNGEWISKEKVEAKGGGIGSSIEYTKKFDPNRNKEVVDEIISISKPEFILKFGNNFIKNFSTFSECLKLDYFEKNLRNDIKNINSSSSLRNVYETYLKILGKPDFEVEIEILFAKIAYQEQRKIQGKNILPEGFNVFLRKIFEEKLGKDEQNFKKFLEVFVSYHRYFNPSAK